MAAANVCWTRVWDRCSRC